MQNNEFIPLAEHDLFTIGEEEFEDVEEDNCDEDTDLDEDSDEDDSTDSEYSITVKVGLYADEVEKMIRDMREDFQREFF